MLDDTFPLSPAPEHLDSCEVPTLFLPEGWSLAPNTTKSADIAGSFPWGAEELVLSDGSLYITNLPNRYPTFKGQYDYINLDGLVGSPSSGYYPRWCNHRILIQRPSSTSGISQ